MTPDDIMLCDGKSLQSSIKDLSREGTPLESHHVGTVLLPIEIDESNQSSVIDLPDQRHFMHVMQRKFKC